MSATLIPSLSELSHPLWSTIRFRRAKDNKGWALLGIPRQVYPLVVVRLFEQQARLIRRYENEGFISVLFEGPSALPARLACVFPAPPGCEGLRVSEECDRILTGKAARSVRAISQRPDPTEGQLALTS